MRFLSLLILTLGIALAGVSAYYIDEFNKVQQAANVRASSVERILVARRPLSQNHALQPEDVILSDWPAARIPAGAFTSVEALLGEGGDGLRVVSRPMATGEAILVSKLYGLGDQGGIERRIPDGWRAVALPLNPVSGVSGFVLPDDIVDIVLTYTRSGKLTNQVVLEAVQVLAVDQVMDTGTRRTMSGHTATVLVTAHDAMLLSVAKQQGELSLMLRGDEASASHGESGSSSRVTVDDLPGRVTPEGDDRPFVWKSGGGSRTKVYLD